MGAWVPNFPYLGTGWVKTWQAERSIYCGAAMLLALGNLQALVDALKTPSHTLGIRFRCHQVTVCSIRRFPQSRVRPRSTAELPNILCMRSSWARSPSVPKVLPRPSTNSFQHLPLSGSFNLNHFTKSYPQRLFNTAESSAKRQKMSAPLIGTHKYSSLPEPIPRSPRIS